MEAGQVVDAQAGCTAERAPAVLLSSGNRPERIAQIVRIYIDLELPVPSRGTSRCAEAASPMPPPRKCGE